ncbi:MAG: MFS transporter [Thermoprotei archaeon]
MAHASTSRSKIFPSQTDVRTLLVYNALQGLYTGYIGVFWQPFLISLGIGVATIGLLEGLAGRSGILASSVQVIGGRLSDSVGRKRLVLAGSGFLVSCWSVASLAFYLRETALIPLSYVLWSLSAAALPVLDAVLADNVASHERPRVYSLVTAANTVPSGAMGYLAGTVLYRFGPITLLILAAILEASGFLLLSRRLTTRPAPLLEKEAEREAGRLVDVFARVRKHWKLFLTFAADSVSWSIGFSIVYALLRADKGFGPGLFAEIAGFMPLGMIVGTVPGGFLATRIGARTLLTVSEALGCSMWLGWALYPQPALVPVYSFVWGVAIMTWVPVQFQVATASFPGENRGELLGALATFRGLIASSGPFIATALYLKAGYSAPFLASSLGIALTIILILKLLPPVHTKELGFNGPDELEQKQT